MYLMVRCIGSILVIGVGSYCIVCGGIVVMTCMSVFAVSGSCCGVQSLWFAIRMVIVCASSLASILAQRMAF